MPKFLYLDFETRSELDLQIVGLDNYLKHKSTKVLMLSYAFDDDEVQIWYPHLGPMPTVLRESLPNSNITKLAWYVSFERGAFKNILGIDIPLEQWIDIMVWARHLSLPGSLEECGEALGLSIEESKMKEGKLLIKKFSLPYDRGGEITIFGITEPAFYDYITHPKEWELFGEYCKQDTRSERTIFKLMTGVPLPKREQELWVLDQKINEMGIPVNRKFVVNALDMALDDKRNILSEIKEITKLDNPNSQKQLLSWVRARGYPYKSLNKTFIIAALKSGTALTKECKQILELRQDGSKTAITKLETLLNILSDDGFVRFQFLFLGASRSGRWTGKDMQPQNLPRTVKWVEKHTDDLMKLVMDYDLPNLNLLIDRDRLPDGKKISIVAIMTSLIRNCFQAPPGYKFAVCDLSAIENRVLGWVSGCEAILDVFRKGLDPYVAFACLMYNLPYEVLIKDKDKRQIAKPAVLGAGYGLGPGVDRIEHEDGTVEYVAITKVIKGDTVLTGLLGYAKNMGIDLTPEQAYNAWSKFREAYPEVVSAWDQLEKAAMHTLKTGEPVEIGPVVFDRLTRKNGKFIMRIKLPSGRYLHYINARIESRILISKKTGKTYKKATLKYEGIGHGVGAIGSGWGPVWTYGGKLMENIVQAISRDILADAMTSAHVMGANIVLHVHDEIVSMFKESDSFAFRLADLRQCMSTTPDWAPGLPLSAEGYEGYYYRKG